MRRWILALLAIMAGPLAAAQQLPTVYRGGAAPKEEFAATSNVRVMPGGNEVEINGSFSAAVAPALASVLKQEPRVRTVRLESPGGSIQSALAVATIMRDHGMDTYVGRSCMSACTLAYLGGHQRSLGPAARLGFHQASAAGVAPDRLDPMLRQAYAQSGVPPGFIDHVLRTPPDSIWFPDRDELKAAGFITGPVPAAVVVTGDAVSATWSASRGLLRWASDASLIQFGSALSALLGELQSQRDTCWKFMHQEVVDLDALATRRTLGMMTTTLRQVRNDVSQAPVVGLAHDERTHVVTALFAALPVVVRDDTREALSLNGDHSAYCPAMRRMLNTALGLPEGERGPALRALLPDG